MVGADAAKTLQPCQRERRIMEDVIERPAAKRVVGVEGAEHAASATRIEHAADTLEKPRRVDQATSLRSPATIAGLPLSFTSWPTIKSSASRSSVSCRGSGGRGWMP